MLLNAIKYDSHCIAESYNLIVKCHKLCYVPLKMNFDKGAHCQEVSSCRWRSVPISTQGTDDICATWIFFQRGPKARNNHSDLWSMKRKGGALKHDTRDLGYWSVAMTSLEVMFRYLCRSCDRVLYFRAWNTKHRVQETSRGTQNCCGMG